MSRVEMWSIGNSVQLMPNTEPWKIDLKPDHIFRPTRIVNNLPLDAEKQVEIISLRLNGIEQLAQPIDAHMWSLYVATEVRRIFEENIIRQFKVAREDLQRFLDEREWSYPDSTKVDMPTLNIGGCIDFRGLYHGKTPFFFILTVQGVVNVR